MKKPPSCNIPVTNHFSIAIPPTKSSSEGHSSIAHPPSESSSGVPASIALSPSKSIHKAPRIIWTHGSVDSPVSHHKHYHSKRKSHNPTPAPTYPVQAPSYSHQGPSVFRWKPPFSSPKSRDVHAPAPAPSPAILPVPSPSPRISPLGSSLKKKKTPPPAYTLVLPPPPPNKDCLSMTCSEPLTYTPPGSPCGCVWPLQVKLHINIAIYKVFPLVSELAKEIAASVLLNHSQVRIVGADAANQQLEKTTVLIDLVPKGVKFDDTTAFLIYKKFWHREILIDASVFGAYEVLYVHYPGLPPSPPSTPQDASGIDDGPSPGHDNNGTMMKPLGVDVPKKKKEGNNGRMIVIIVLSSVTAFVVFIGLAWLCLLKCRSYVHEHEPVPDGFISPSSKQSRAARSLTQGIRLGSGSQSFNSGTITYTGYLAPEYAMTGHLLVKSDVYSYGVVLLELLTGRKPVDLSQPPGQENLVTWVRPLLTSKEGLQMIVDPFVKPNISVDIVVKVAAIASMCVQPEVSQRPFMGEVVQALKLVCSDFEETDFIRSKSSQEGLLTDVEGKYSEASVERVEFSEYQKTLSGYQSGEEKVRLSATELLSTSGQEFESFRRYSRSGPLTIGKKRQFWQKLRSLSRGSSSEHGSH
ncbi:hypothetical protein JHK85_017649 [Glycine max]|nr:hypothetical protein JHK85_017649 [Glycine max]